MDPLRIVIVDDHPLFRKGLAGILRQVPEIETVAMTDDFEYLKRICDKDTIDVILMDADLGQACGANITRKMKSLFPDLKFLALSAHLDAQYVFNMLKAGALGYVLKDTDIDELSTAIKSTAKGKTYFSSSISKLLVQSAKEKADPVNLTLRELEILKFLVQDELSNKEIANLLYISPRTVETHKRNLIQKLKVKNSIGLAKYYFQHDLDVNKVYGIPVG